MVVLRRLLGCLDRDDWVRGGGRAGKIKREFGCKPVAVIRLGDQMVAN